ncbi:MAG TPA: glycosyltransferase WbuB [Verrucomicrobiales bacterium]|nr:glycosyltransferase WbuB [Verrucomicrobiales bacterium]HIL70784.1 glycosyltransferase WbuB [Verrucomicrobiota bacterium]
MKDSAGKPCILILVENLPVPLDRRVWQESCTLRDAGYEVVVICPRMRGYTALMETLDGIHIYRHWISDEAGGFFGFILEYLSALWGEMRLAWKVWRRHRFKVIHLCNPPDLLFLVALPFKLLGVRVIYDVHDLWPEMFEAKFENRGLFYYLVRIAESMTYRISDLVLATNETVRRVALERGRKTQDTVFVVRTAPKISTGEVSVNPELKKNRQFLVGYVGVMGNADGVEYLVRAADHLVNKSGRLDVQFLLMGTGPEYDHLVSLRDSLGLQEFVDLPGRVSNEFLFSALKTIDLGVSCDPKNTYNDGCTMNKVLEYMAFGKAQVMFDLVEGRASALEASNYVVRNSSEDLAQEIIDLLEQPKQREKMGAFGKKRLQEQLNWEKSVESLLSAYRKVLEI